MADIVGIGFSVFDFMINMDKWIEEDSKDGYGESKVQCGGPAAVALIAANKLGVPSAFLGKVGDDAFGITIRDQLKLYGVDLSGFTVVPGGSSPRCVVLSNRSNGTRSIVDGGGWDDPSTQLHPEEIDPEVIRNAKLLLLDGSDAEAGTYAAKIAKEAGVKILMDTEGTIGKMDPMLELADVIIPSENRTRVMSGLDDPEEGALFLYEKFKPEILVTTLGPKGGIIVMDGVATKFDAFEVNAIDSNGAGDVFHGAWAAAMVKGMDPFEATRFAAAASAIKCTHFGASEGAPDYDTVMKFLAEH